MTKRRNYKELPDVELPTQLDEIIRAKTEVADNQIEETRVNFRWGREQVSLVKRVADFMGVPYQTYIKQVIFKQALVDLEATLFATMPEGTGIGRIAAWNRQLLQVSEPAGPKYEASWRKHTWLLSSLASLDEETKGMTIRELLDSFEKGESNRAEQAESKRAEKAGR
jgi:predicted DNA binding CopG/RHH family protein